MKRYNIFKLKNFYQLSRVNKLKFFLKSIGLKKIIYKIFYFIFNIILNNNSYFFKSIIFDLKKKLGKYVIVQNKNKENYILFTNDQIISKEMFVKGEFDLNKLKKVIRFLKKKNYVIENLFDIGANIGVISIPAISKGLVNKAYAIEPEPDNYKLLKANIIINDLEEKINCFNLALSNENSQTVDMEISADNSGDHRVRNIVKFNTHGEENRKIIKIKTEKFDNLFNESDYKNSLIKIDTQGHEPLIIDGATKLIKNKIPIIIEFWPYVLKRNNTWEKMLETLKKFEYFVDLSDESLTLKKIDEESIKELSTGWDKEQLNKFPLFTDLLLL